MLDYTVVSSKTQDMIDKLIKIGGCYGMEMNVEKTNVMRICGAEEGWKRSVGPNM
jgi:hypothetical protein